jgi:hypothetical protein
MRILVVTRSRDLLRIDQCFQSELVSYDGSCYQKELQVMRRDFAVSLFCDSIFIRASDGCRATPSYIYPVLQYLAQTR